MSDYEIHELCVRHPRRLRPFKLPPGLFTESGKVARLVDELRRAKELGEKVLVFSQFVIVLDILEPIIVEHAGIKFVRLDGSTKVDERMSIVDEFSADASITAFLLSTKAGGQGLTLTA